MNEIEINYNLKCIMNIYDEFFIQTPESIQSLYKDIYDYEPNIEIINNFLELHYDGDYINKKHENSTR
jgi:hypothetical protein